MKTFRAFFVIMFGLCIAFFGGAFAFINLGSGAGIVAVVLGLLIVGHGKSMYEEKDQLPPGS